MQAYDVMVIGVGGVGAAICYRLAKRGLRVLGVEQFAIPHDLGGTHGYSRQTKIAPYVGGPYEPLVRRSYDLFQQLREDAALPELMVPTGFLDIGQGQPRAAYRIEKGAYEFLDYTALSRRFPQFCLPDAFWGVWDPMGAVLHPERTTTAHVRLALALGAHIQAHTRVHSWATNGSGVSVQTDRGTYHADRLVLAAGPWTGKLLQDLGVVCTANRMSFSWVWPKRNVDAYALGSMPCWCVGDPAVGTYYGFPMMSDAPGFKIGLHWHGDRVDPDDVDRTPNARDEQQIRCGLSKYLPDADGCLLATRTCLYDHTPDDVPILDLHPDCPRVTLCGPLCGAGFKFIPAYAEIAADLVEMGYSNQPAAFLKIARLLPSRKALETGG